MNNVTKFKTGTFFEQDGDLWKAIDVAPTASSDGFKIKVKNVLSGKVLTKTIKSDQGIKEANIIKKNLQFLNKEGNSYLFMDPITFAQVEVSKVVVADSEPYLIDGQEFSVKYWKKAKEEVVVGVDLPPKMEFVIKESESVDPSNSSSDTYKQALLSNGIKVSVPTFVNAGDKVRIDTKTGEYVERV